MALQIYTLALGNLKDDQAGNNYSADTPVYILKSDGLFANIYSDSSGSSLISQNGIDNISNASGEFTFYVESGQYIARVNGKENLINVIGSTYFDSRVEDSVSQIIEETLSSRGFRVVGDFASGFTYELPNDVAIDGSGNYWVYADINALPVTVSAGTTPSAPTYTQTTFNQASAVTTTAGINAQQFIDNFELKIFQSPTDNLTKVSTFAGGVGVVYEVRKTSDNSLATIYSDKDGVTEIVQNGTDNVSNGDAEAVFYIVAGEYNVTVGAETSSFTITNVYGITFNTLDDLVSAPIPTYRIGDTVKLRDRVSNYGGGAPWLIVDATTVTPNGAQIVASTANTAIAFELKGWRSKKVKLKEWGAIPADSHTAITGFDNGDILQVIFDEVADNGLGDVLLGSNWYYTTKALKQKFVNDGLGINPLTLRGEGTTNSGIFTAAGVDIFEDHSDNFNLYDLAFKNSGLDGITKHSGVGVRSPRQSRFCNWNNVTFWWFKFSTLQRFTVFNRYEKITSNGSRGGLKFARSDDMENPNNPSPPGVWNASDGWFHNQNTFRDILINGEKESAGGKGEFGFWGALQGCSFDGITVQNFERVDPSQNVVLPVGQVSTCIQIEGGGATSTRSLGNYMQNVYIERSFKGLKFADQDEILIHTLFTQGQAGGENLLECNNSTITIHGQSNQSAGWSADVVATNSNITIDRPIQSNGGFAGRDLTSTYFSENGIKISPTIKIKEVTATTEFGAAVTLDSTANTISYERQNNIVTISGRIDVTSTASTNGSFININDLPFAAANPVERAGNGGGAIPIFGGASPELSPYLILENASSIRVYTDLTTIAGKQLYFTISYFTSDFS